ncbi:Tn3 family transposase [Streptomyces klenkii]|uniref:Tn3 family transposase n=1 Tax=Streptomyces klenkii TaxID=1420899 RepID=UPI00344388F7
MTFTSLLAILVIPHNTLDIADVVRQLQAEGQVVAPLNLALISPYLTERINRSGAYSTHELGSPRRTTTPAPTSTSACWRTTWSRLPHDRAPGRTRPLPP